MQFWRVQRVSGANWSDLRRVHERFLRQWSSRIPSGKCDRHLSLLRLQGVSKRCLSSRAPTRFVLACLPTLLLVAILHPISLSLGLMLTFHTVVTNSIPRWRYHTTIDGATSVFSRHSSRQIFCYYSLGVATFHTTGDRRGTIYPVRRCRVNR